MEDVNGGEFLNRAEALASKRLSKVHDASEIHKLDVLSANQINFLAFFNYTMLTLCFLYTVVTVAMTNTVLSTQVKFKFGNHTHLLRACKEPFWHKVMNTTFPLILFALSLFLAIIYTIRVCRNTRSRPTATQIFVMILIWASVLDNNPLPAINYVHDQLFHPNNKAVWLMKIFPYYVAFAISWFLKITAFSAAQGFYVLAVAHSYRLPRGTALGWRFYLPKIVPFVIQLALRLYGRYGLKPNVLTSSLMFTTAASAISAAHRLPLAWGWRVNTFLVVFTSLEVYVFFHIVLQIITTSRALHRLDYAENRSQQIGFRFFVSQSLFYFGWTFALDCIRRLAIPAIHPLFYYKNFNLYHFDNLDFDMGIKLMLFTFVIVTAYAHLPPDSVGIRGWFRGAEEDDLHRLTPISLALYEMKEKFVDAQDHTNSFILETGNSLFNFAWLIYDWETKKHGRVSMTQRSIQFKVGTYISDAATDTHALIVDGIDRIILAFRGTSSFENMKTDLNFARSPVSGYLPTNPDVQHEMMNERDWRRANAHTGFLRAYKTVSAEVIDHVKGMLKNKERSIFCTGHSLGGALATICSLDLFLSLSFTDVAVFTFGSPKVGNYPFAELYDRYIPAHWRVSVASDIITGMPKGGFKHCGKKVFITHGGDIFLDPNVLEMQARSRVGHHPFFHKKSSYKIGLLVIADKYSQVFRHELWNFPISKKDVAKWEKLMMKDNGLVDIVECYEP